MNASFTFQALTAEQWIDREIADLTRLRYRLRNSAPINAVQSAARYETAAEICIGGLQQPDLSASARQSLLWVAGRHAFKGKVYRALAEESTEAAA